MTRNTYATHFYKFLLETESALQKNRIYHKVGQFARPLGAYNYK